MKKELGSLSLQNNWLAFLNNSTRSPFSSFSVECKEIGYTKGPVELKVTDCFTPLQLDAYEDWWYSAGPTVEGTRTGALVLLLGDYSISLEIYLYVAD